MRPGPQGVDGVRQDVAMGRGLCAGDCPVLAVGCVAAPLRAIPRGVAHSDAAELIPLGVAVNVNRIGPLVVPLLDAGADSQYMAGETPGMPGGLSRTPRNGRGGHAQRRTDGIRRTEATMWRGPLHARHRRGEETVESPQALSALGFLNSSFPQNSTVSPV